MEILIIFNPQVSYPQLSTLSPQLTQKFPSSTVNQQSMNTINEAVRTMDPSVLRIAIILTKEILPNIYQSILQNLNNVNCQFILYPETIQPFNIPKNMIASSKMEIFNKINQYYQRSQRVENPKSIRMIAIKRSDNSETNQITWNSLGFNVLRSKDLQFNKQMNTVFFKYKNNKNIKFNQIRDLAEIPLVPNQKQFLVVSHQDINDILPSLPRLNNRTEKVFKILFNTSSKMINSNQVFDLNVNKTSIIRSEIDNYLSKIKGDSNVQRYQDKSKNANSTTITASNNQKAATSMKSDDLYKLFILDNNNPKFKQMYQNLQIEGNVIFNLQNHQINNPKTILLAPYQIKDILVETINPQHGANIVLFDSSGGKDITQNNIDSSKIAFVGKTPEQIKSFLRNKVKFNNQNKIITGRTVKFIEEPPMLSGTSIDKSLLLNKQNNNSSLLYQHQWTVRRKAVANKFVTYFSNRQDEVMNASESAIGQRSMRKMTTKKKTMVNLVEHQPSIKVIQSQHVIDVENPSVTRVVNQYYSTNQNQNPPNPNNVNIQITQNVAQMGQNMFNTQRSNKQIAEYYQNNIQINKVLENGHGSIINIPKPSISSKIIQDEYDQTVISIKNSKIKSKITDPKPNNQTQINIINQIITDQFKPDITPQISNIQSNSKQSSIGSLSLNENSILNATSNFGYSPSANSTITRNLRLDNKNLSISIKPSIKKQIKQDKQVIQIMTTRGAPTTTSTPTKNIAQQYKSQSIPKNQERVIRSTSIDPSFVDHKYERVVENGITKYVIKQEYKDELIKKILHERQPLNQIHNHNKQRVYSTQKSEILKYDYNQYFGNQRFQQSPRYMNPMTERSRPVSKPPLPSPTTARYKQNYSPFPSSIQYSPRTIPSSATKNILYIIPNNRQTLIDRVKQIVTKNDTILPYNTQSQLQSFSFQTYKIVFLFPKDQNRQSLLNKITNNCYVIKLNKQSKKFNQKQLFINDIKQLPKIYQQKVTKSKTHTTSPSQNYITFQSIIIIPAHISHIKNSFNAKYQLYNSTEQLYDLLQNLKMERLIVIIENSLREFIDDFNMPTSTSFVVYDRGAGNQSGLMAEIRALAVSY